jgi:hypothetical protein
MAKPHRKKSKPRKSSSGARSTQRNSSSRHTRPRKSTDEKKLGSKLRKPIPKKLRAVPPPVKHFEKERAEQPASVSDSYRRIRKAEWKRWKALADNSEFVWETFRLKYQLMRFLENDPEPLRNFFNREKGINGAQFKSLIERVERIKNPTLQNLLKRYASYALRYGVELVLRGTGRYCQVNGPQFQVHGTGFWGSKFHVVIRDGTLEPVSDSKDEIGNPMDQASPPEDERDEARYSMRKPRVVGILSADEPYYDEAPLSDAFHSDEVRVPARLQKLIESGKAKYVSVDDEDNFSLIRQLMDFAYSPDQITVIEYGSSFRHQFYLVGEHVALNRVSATLQKVATAFQRGKGGHDQRGRPPDRRRLYGRLTAIIRIKEAGDRVDRLLENEDRSARLQIWVRKSPHKESPAVPDAATRRANMQSLLSQYKSKLEK